MAGGGGGGPGAGSAPRSAGGDAAPAASPRVRAAGLVVALLFVALGAGFVATVPLFEAPDEPAHVHYVGFVARHGRAPAAAQWPEVPGGAMQPPLYYFAAAPLFDRLWPRDSAGLLAELGRASRGLYRIEPGAAAANRLVRPRPRGRVRFPETPPILEPLRGLRWPSLGFGLLAVALTGVGVARATRDPALGVLAAAILALNPQFLFVSAAVGNDGAAAAAGAACLAVLAGPLRDGGFTRRDALLLAAVSALALMTKLSTAPVVAVSAAWLALRDPRPAADRARDLAWAAALGLLLLAPWLLWNAQHRGDPLGWTAVMASAAHLPGPALEDGTLRYLLGTWAPKTFESYWGRFGWMTLRMPAGLTLAYAGFTALGLLGAAAARRGAAIAPEAARAATAEGAKPTAAGAAPPGLRPYAAAACLAAVAAHVWLNLQTEQAQGRHLFAAAPHLAGLLALGVAAWGRALPGVAGRALPVLVVAALLAGALFCLLGVIAPVYAAG